MWELTTHVHFPLFEESTEPRDRRAEVQWYSERISFEANQVVVSAESSSFAAGGAHLFILSPCAPNSHFNIDYRTLILLTPHGKSSMLAPFSGGATR